MKVFFRRLFRLFPYLVLLSGSIWIAWILFNPPLYVTSKGAKFPYASHKYVEIDNDYNESLYPTPDYITAILHSMGIDIITGMVFYLLRKVVSAKTIKISELPPSTTSPEIEAGTGLPVMSATAELGGGEPEGEVSGGDIKGATGSQTERLKHGGILVCRECGSKNRVAGYSPNLRPICGNCRNPLSESLSSKLRRVASRFKPVWIGACVVVGVIVLVNLTNQTPSRTPVSAGHIIDPATVKFDDEPIPNKVEQTPTQKEEDRQPLSNRRLSNGTVIRSVKLNGEGELKINNGSSTDAVAKLVDPQTDRCVASVYICARAVYTLKGIPDGNYRLLFGLGEDWDNAKSFFSRPQGASEFSDMLPFTTESRSDGNYIHHKSPIWRVTLNPVLGGNARTHTVSMTEFDKY